MGSMTEKMASYRQHFDFQAINNAVLENPSYLERRLPHARMEGQELVAGDIQGNPGKSFKLNRVSGKWSDFAADEKGGDVISFVAAQEGISQMPHIQAMLTQKHVQPCPQC